MTEEEDEREKKTCTQDRERAKNTDIRENEGKQVYQTEKKNEEKQAI